MHNKKKKIAIIIFTFTICLTSVISLGIFLNSHFSPVQLLNSGLNATTYTKENKEKVNIIYDDNFIFDNSTVKSAKVFVPEYKQTSSEDISFYAQLFDFSDEYFETDDYYYFENENATLKVYKYYTCLEYSQKDYVESETNELVKDSDIINYAKEFLREKLLLGDYMNSSVSFDGDKYSVIFIEKLSDYQNYSFNTTVNVDKDGTIISFEYYKINFDKIDYVNLKSMRDAYYELPTDFEDGVNIDINDCRLVYIFEESIVQPAYLFEGEITGGKTFQCFVKGSKFK